jgi:hypothetical protein
LAPPAGSGNIRLWTCDEQVAVRELVRDRLHDTVGREASDHICR